MIALSAQQQGKKVHITIYDKNLKIMDTTTACICPSLTTDEMSSVIPPVDALREGLAIPFNEPKGLRVVDVPGLDQSPSGNRFLQEVAIQDQDKAGILARQQALLLMGKMSMELWRTLYDKSDPELRAILEASNFRPCRETNPGEEPFRGGYRIDLLYGMENPENQARAMIANYQKLGYKHCRLLSPEEVMEKDPTLRNFCETHSHMSNGTRQWNSDSVAILRPGGCINASLFIPQIIAYLSKNMGTYINKKGKKKPCFQVKLDRRVSGVRFKKNGQKRLIAGLNFASGYQKKGQHSYKKITYLFCPGEAVGTCEALGFKEPAYAGFAGASLILTLPIPVEKKDLAPAFTHWMEVHKPDIVLAWQARSDGQNLGVACGGTKAFYADKLPLIMQAFAVNRNLVQLNIMNEVLPWAISLALKRDTTGQALTQEDMDALVQAGIAKRWVGVRAVAFDGMPTISHAYLQTGERVENGIIITHLGSGGVSFSPAAAAMALSLQGDASFNIHPEVTQTILSYTDSARVAQKTL